MTLTFLAFRGRVSRTICAFTSDEELNRFVQLTACDAPVTWETIPTVNPLREAIPTFATANDALDHFNLSNLKR